jgi:PAS domain S-box-containing protein
MPYEAYFKSAAESLLVVNLEGRIVDVNDASERLFGYAKDELLGQAVEMLLPERLRARHQQHRAKYVSMPKSRPMGIGMDLAGRRKDGSEFPIEVSLTFAHSNLAITSSAPSLISVNGLRLSARRNAMRLCPRSEQ